MLARASSACNMFAEDEARPRLSNAPVLGGMSRAAMLVDEDVASRPREGMAGMVCGRFRGGLQVGGSLEVDRLGHAKGKSQCIHW